MGSNYDLALRLARAGWSVHPCINSGDDRKKPLTNWRTSSTSNPATLARLWRNNPDAAPGLDLAKRNFLVVDGDPGGDGVRSGWDWFVEQCDAHGYDVGRVPVVKTPSGGRHGYFRQVEGQRLGNGRGALPPKSEVDLDIRGAGGFTIAPGAVMDVGTYELVDDGCTLDDAPEVPGWLVEILTAERIVQAERPPVASAPRPPAPSDDMRVAAYVERALDDEAMQVRTAPKGGRNAQLNASALKIGHYVGAGHIGESLVVETLTRAGQEAGLGAVEIRNTIRSGIEAGKREPRDPPPPEDDGPGPIIDLSRQLAALGAPAHDPETGELDEVDPDDDDISRIDALEREFSAPVDPTYPGGLLGDIVDWIIASSVMPNRPLALGAAVAAVCGVISRHTMGPTSSGTQLYIAAVGQTGVGKDRPLEAIESLYIEAGLSAHVNTLRVMSGQAVDALVQARKTVVGLVDEMGENLFGKAMARNASSHERAIMTNLRTLWSCRWGKSYQLPARAAGGSERVETPALTIFGVTTYDQFFAALSASDAAAGSLNRWLVMRAAPRDLDDIRTPSPNLLMPPRGLVTALRSLLRDPLPNQNTTGGALDLVHDGHPASPYQNRWAPGPAEGIYERLRRAVLTLQDDFPKAANCYGRTAEMAVRLAAVHAISRRGRTADVDEEAIRWGATLALQSARFMAGEMRLRSAESRFQADCQAVEMMFRDEPSRRMTKRRLIKRMNHRWNAKDREAILQALVESSVLTAFMDTSGRVAVPAFRYVRKD